MPKKILAISFVAMLILFCAMSFHAVTDAASRVIKTVTQGKKPIVEAEVEQFAKDQRSAFFRIDDFIDVNGLAHAMMGQRWMNGRVKLDDGRLIQVFGEKDLSHWHAESIASLSEVLQERGISFLYVQAPVGIDPTDRGVPPGIHDFSNQNMDSLLKALRGAQTPVLDLREKIKDDGLELYDLFFKTDCHWTPDTGLWAFGKISQELKVRYGMAVEERIADPEQYEREVFKGIFLGSDGKRTGKFFAGMDEMTLLKPKYETELSQFVQQEGTEESGIERSGTFEEVVFRRKNLEKKNLKRNPYYAYLGDIYGRGIYRNALAKRPEKILFISDSFGLVVIPYFALAFQEVHTIEPRRYVGGTIIDYIDQEKPDCVVMMFFPGTFFDENIFSFGL